MKIIDTIRLSAQAISRYPLRTFMLVLAIAVGVAAVVLLTAVGEGARQYVNGQFTSLGTHLLIILPGKTETSGAGVTGVLMGETPRDLTLQDAIALHRSVHVEKVTPIILGSGTASWRQRQREITVIGTTAEMLDIQSWRIELGQFLPAVDMDVATPVCVIGSVVKDEFFGNTNPIGQWLRIGDTRCRISGTLAQAGRTSFLDSDELVILPVANAQQLFDAPGLFRILVQTTGPQVINQAKQDIIEIRKRFAQFNFEAYVGCNIDSFYELMATSTIINRRSVDGLELYERGPMSESFDNNLTEDMEWFIDELPMSTRGLFDQLKQAPDRGVTMDVEEFMKREDQVIEDYRDKRRDLKDHQLRAGPVTDS